MAGATTLIRLMAVRAGLPVPAALALAGSMLAAVSASAQPAAPGGLQAPGGPASANSPRGAGATAPDPGVFPDAVTIVRFDAGFRYADKTGRTLYAADPFEAQFRRGTAIDYCTQACATAFTPLAAAEGAVAVGLWRPVKISTGLAWAYRGGTVYTFNADAPGEARGEKYDGVIRSLEHVPREPAVTAPNAVVPVYAKGHWLLAGKDRRFLFVRNGDCRGDGCLEATPFVAGLAAKPFGEWTIVDRADNPQWAYRGKPVFVAAQPDAKPSARDGEAIAVGE